MLSTYNVKHISKITDEEKIAYFDALYAFVEKEIKRRADPNLEGDSKEFKKNIEKNVLSVFGKNYEDVIASIFYANRRKN